MPSPGSLFPLNFCYDVFHPSLFSDIGCSARPLSCFPSWRLVRQQVSAHKSLLAVRIRFSPVIEAAYCSLFQSACQMLPVHIDSLSNFFFLWLLLKLVSYSHQPLNISLPMVKVVRLFACLSNISFHLFVFIFNSILKSFPSASL